MSDYTKFDNRQEIENLKKLGVNTDNLITYHVLSEEEKMQSPRYRKEKKKEEREWKKQLKDKPEFLMLLARFFYKVIHFLHFIYSLCGLSNLYFAWKIYKVCSVAGWLGIVQTKYTLYIVLYFAIWFIVSKLNFKLYLYGNDEF